jgi:hypothetical protein
MMQCALLPCYGCDTAKMRLFSNEARRFYIINKNNVFTFKDAIKAL